MKNGIEVEKSNDVSSFYRIFSMTFTRQNRDPPVSETFLKAVINLLEEKQLGELWIAKAPSGESVAGEIIVWDNKRAYRWAAATHTSFRSLGVASLLLYSIFKDLKSRKFKEINLMAANKPKLAKFMSSFNPRLIPYYAVEKSNLKYKLTVGDLQETQAFNGLNRARPYMRKKVLFHLYRFNIIHW